MLAAEERPFVDREKQTNYNAPRVNLSLNDFNILGHVGDGSFSSVILCSHKQSGVRYAIKVMSKHLIVRNKMVEYIKNERHILDHLDYVGVAKLFFTFQDEQSLYLGMEYCAGGDLYNHLEHQKKLSLKDATFYAAEIVLILEYLRNQQVVHRDLKPENLLLTKAGHLKLIDFGSAKAFFLPPEQARTNKNRATSFVGTADYVSPEVLNNTGISYSADLWALGCIIFQMLAGKPPFKAASEYLSFQLISAREFTFPDDFPPSAKDLVDKLLVLEPNDRIGAQSFEPLKSHPFFEGIIWDNIWEQDAPVFQMPPSPTSQDHGLDWELTSLTKGQPVQYHYD